MKTKLAILALAGFAFAGPAVADAPCPACGVWQSPSRGAHIEIAPCATSAICGTLLSASRPKSNPQLLDVHNKDPAKRNLTLIGQVVITGFKGGPAKWTGGRLYNPGDGNFYSGAITLVGESRLKLKGCAFGFLCKSQTWTRVQKGASATD
jgi:uncharacterized protein (DUF2147 family)